MKSLAGYIFGILVLLVAAKFGGLLGENIIELRRLEALQTAARAEVQNLENRNAQLAAESRALDEDAFYVELTIRRRLRWMRPDEMPGKYDHREYHAPAQTLVASAATSTPDELDRSQTESSYPQTEHVCRRTGFRRNAGESLPILARADLQQVRSR